MTDTKEQTLWQALREVVEPDLGENIVDLGLVRALRTTGDRIKIDITMTSQHSPYAGVIRTAVQDAVQAAGVADVDVSLVWDPAWTPFDMAEPLRSVLGLPEREPPLPVYLPAPVTWRQRIRARLRG